MSMIVNCDSGGEREHDLSEQFSHNKSAYMSQKPRFFGKSYFRYILESLVYVQGG